jgi:hypothetical protein
VEDRLKPVERPAPDASCGGVLGCERGVGCLEVTQFAQQEIVVSVGDRRGRLLVITPVVFENLGTELNGAHFRGGHGRYDLPL